MKTKLALFAIIALVVISSRAQTNAITDLMPPMSVAQSGLLQEAWDDYVVSTNAAFVFSAGFKVQDTGTHIYAASYIYNFNSVAGLIIGYDYITGSAKGESVANAVRGGLTLKAPFAPLKSFGITNFVVAPWAAELVSTTVSGNNTDTGSAGLVSCVGLDTAFYKFGWGELHGGVFYENRTSQGWASGNYYLADLAVTINRLPKF